METESTVGSECDCFVHNAAQSTFVDITHCEGCNAGFSQDLAFVPIDVANANEHDVASLDFGCVIKNIREFFRAAAKTTCERHAMYVATRACFRRVHIGVRVDPNEASFFTPLAKNVADSGHGSHRNGVVAPEH